MQFGDTLFEFLHHRAVVSQPLVVQYLRDVLHERIAVSAIGPSHVQRFDKSRRCTIDGEICRAANGFDRHENHQRWWALQLWRNALFRRM